MPTKIKKHLKKHQYFYAFLVILLIGLFFRTFKLVEWFHFDHDNDLASWIVKDMAIDHHIRLIGQLTSAKGIFIGGGYYYLITPFYLLFNMDPVGSLIPLTLLGTIAIISYYFVFNKLYNPIVGLIITFLYSTSVSSIFFDRRVVPSTPTNIWVVWYFYTVIMITRGNYSILPLVGILAGTIWHIHVALAPAFLALPIAMIMSKKWPSFKQILFTILTFAITSIPLALFEFKHNFSQLNSLFSNFSSDHGAATGLDKFNLVTIYLGRNLDSLFLSPLTIPGIDNRIWLVLTIVFAILLVYKKILKLKEIVPLAFWFFGVIIFFTISSSPISEYYLYNVEILSLFVFSFVGYLIYKSSNKGKIIILVLLSLILAKDLYYFFTFQPYKKGYVERKNAIAFIAQDAKQKGYPCIAISYITTPGENFGYRYFIWLNNLHTTRTDSGNPIYTIVSPDELAKGVPMAKFEHIGVITPDHDPNKDNFTPNCNLPNSNTEDSMFGFVK